MIEAVEFINNGMHVISLLKIIIDTRDLWPSVCHLVQLLHTISAQLAEYNLWMTMTLTI